MVKLGGTSSICRGWGEITTRSLDEWKETDEKSPFLPDNRRGYARVTPVALSKDGVSGQAMYSIDQFPVEGLKIYEDFESSSQFSGYVWSDWPNKMVQPMNVDDAFKAMINQPARSDSKATMASSQPGAQSTAMSSTENKGSGVSSFFGVSSTPEPSRDVCMESSADKTLQNLKASR